MTIFERRQQAFERKFVHDEYLTFLAKARRNRRLGLWAAEQMRLPEPEAFQYAALLLRIGAVHGDAVVFNQVRSDLQHARQPISEHRIRRRMDELLAEASRTQQEPDLARSTPFGASQIYAA